MFAGNVSLPLFPAPALTPPNAEGNGPSALNATSGLLAVITKSTASKISAMRWLSNARRDSILARASVPYFPNVASTPKRISGVSTSAHAGQWSASWVCISTIPLIDHAAPMRGSEVLTVIMRSPVAVHKCFAYSSSCVHIADDTTAPPQSGASTTVLPRSESV